MRRTRKIAAVSLALLATLPTVSFGAGAGEEKTSWQTDDEGRLFRTAFDPGKRFILGTGVMLGGADRDVDGRAAITTGVWYRQTMSSGMKHDVVRWQLEHRFLDAVVTPTQRGTVGWPAMQASLYRGTFLRHADNATITLPGDPPRQIHFPLDVGAEAGVGSVEIKPRVVGRSTDVRLGVARAAVLVDPWRPGRPGNALEIGIGARYDLDIATGENGGAAQTVHRVAPFTAASVRWRQQDATGLTSLDTRCDGVPYWKSEGGFSFLGEASARFERVLIALNDQPLGLLMDASARADSGDPDGTTEFRVVSGLVFGFQR